VPFENPALVDADFMANEAGFKWPVALTSAAWADCVAWTEDDGEQQVHQDQSRRLSDLLFMASHATRTSKDSGAAGRAFGRSGAGHVEIHRWSR